MQEKGMQEMLCSLAQGEKEKHELRRLEEENEYTGRFGLQLSHEEAKELMVCRNESLKRYRRVEFGEGILDRLIERFCDSPYLNQDNYLETLKELQEIFYEFKNETQDKLTDDELLEFMKEQFDGVCFGSTDYLESTCLERYADAIRQGYEGYRGAGGIGEYERFDEEERWDNELYYETLKELTWR